MDEVDIDNSEDLNELESRLYAQVHHEHHEVSEVNAGLESTTSLSHVQTGVRAEVESQNDVKGTKKVLPKRYWTQDESFSVKQSHHISLGQHRVLNQKKHTYSSLNKGGKQITDLQHNIRSSDNTERDKDFPNMEISNESTTSGDALPGMQQSSEHRRNDPSNAVQSPLPKMARHKSNIKRNPVAEWMKRNNKLLDSKTSIKQMDELCIKPKEGPFFKQQQKLIKAKRLENKKHKSKKAKTGTKKQNTIASDIIDLVSSDDTDSSDVVVIPVPPPPTFTVDDSDDEGCDKDGKKKKTDSPVLQPEENALDSADVEMTTSSSFIKPLQTTQQGLTACEVGEKRLDNSSRCTSPCSIQSSDDFIGQNDKSRLLETSGMADDEDLLLLTSDMHSLLEKPQHSGGKNMGAEGCEQKKLDNIVNYLVKSGSSKIATPSSSGAAAKKDYRVEQSQFRALDVYESESDITDSVYSKGASKLTVIRQIDTTSDELEDITSVPIRTKRLRKRRASSSNKGSDVNYENTQFSSDSKSDSSSGAERTEIPFISRGPAVERKIRKVSRTLSISSPASNKSPKSGATKGHMSDGDFIAKLNTLVQGQDDEKSAADSDDDENAPSAREIAEKILGENDMTVPEISVEAAAVPKEVCNDLNDVLSTIDKMEDSEQEQFAKRNDETRAYKCRESRNKNIIYKSVPNENNAQVVTYVADKSQLPSPNKPARQRAKNGSPIYNIVFARGPFSNGGIGWSSEMRKFYEASWKGDDFELAEVLQNMNPDKNLWRICTEDRFTKSVKRFNNLKCTNCCEFGHARSHCKRPRKPLICYMCGQSGHQEPRCPNTICLRCGNKTQVFLKGCNACSFQNRLICPICKIRGHSIDFCPDKWRRYYATTEPNAYPRNSIVYNTKKYCSICGHRGHLSDVCRNAMHLEYPPIATTIKSHQKSYNDIVTKTIFGGIGFNLMYEPTVEYCFDMAGLTSPEKYYGRFLEAIGMGYLLKRKRPLGIDASGVSAKKPKQSHKSTKFVNNICEAPNQVQEISASGSVYQECPKVTTSADDDDGTSVGEVESTVHDEDDIQLNVVTPTTSARAKFSNFKPPNNVTSSNNPPQLLDSDSNYSFSEHFDLPSTSANVLKVMEHSVAAENIAEKESDIRLPVAHKERGNHFPFQMEVMPDFIPLADSTFECDNEKHGRPKKPQGISNRFVVAESEDEENSNKCVSKKEKVDEAGCPCEAKIYLNNFHSKYLLSVEGRNFLAKCSRGCDLKARLDFTSVGYVLVIFGLPNDQDKFQRELLMKYREIADQDAQKHVTTPNIPKRIDVLIRFLRDDINQLSSNLGNANHLFKRLQYVERQQSKSGSKLADKIRRSLNMILVGQAGLKDGNIHLDKLLTSLKTLINDYSSEESTPLPLRTEISMHWKYIFSSYRYDNYQELVKTYNNLVLKNRITNLVIDPLILGNKILDTSLTDEQREKLEQSNPRTDMSSTSGGEYSMQRQTESTPITPKNSKHLKRKLNQTPGSSPTFQSPAKTPVSQNIRSDVMCTPVKAKSTATNATPASVSKRQQNKIMPPPPLANPALDISKQQQVSEKCKNTCASLLKEISAKTSSRKGSHTLDSKLPSTFWSRESMRYLDDCIPIVSSRPELMEKVRRVYQKSKSGQLSYNDYLAVIKLHTALTGK
ncbi:uncharacterized protein LOC106092180 isoform X2 [Stomoxys calcitrans]|uniref:uncharacterized protein LOC106092180 isoform X2 n=1 Tax=Stomoxys calcitrans TaxID=35570 RepID=UPI0027E2A9F5|nr:uncharacterized protein LOC106092180 isoform X2 [Stomoxys calcitrans]